MSTSSKGIPELAPLCADWWDSATADPDQIQAWAEESPGCGFAVALGPPGRGDARAWVTALLVEAGEGEALIALLRPAARRRIRAALRMPNPTGWTFMFRGRSSACFIARVANGAPGLRALGVTERSWVEITGLCVTGGGA